MKKKKYKIKKKPFIILILVVVFIVSLFIYIKGADTRQLKKIGYSKSEISLIKEKASVSIIKKYDYIENIESLLNNSSYKEENLDRYLDLYNEDRDFKDIVYIVNNNITYPYTSKLVELINAKYFVLSKLDRYMSYTKESDINLIIRDVNSSVDYDFYTNTKSANINTGELILVNKYHYLPEDYVYGELVTMDVNYTNTVGSKLSSVAYEAFKKLVDAAEEEGYHIRNNYAHRTYEYQEGVYNNYKNTYSESYADSISARPGYSEHQTGLTLDVGVAYGKGSGKFEDSQEFAWMKENCYKYGFILRYPEGKENITGYSYEPWHYRYVGLEAAKYIYENDITFEEYYTYFVDNNS